MDPLIYLTPKQTKRLIIRPLTWDDAEPWKAFTQDSNCTKFFPEFMTNDANLHETWIQWQLARYEQGRFGLMALVDKESNQLVGQCGLLHQIVNDTDELEIGYHVLSSSHGKGFATEAAQFFKKLGFAFTEAPRIVSLIHPDNLASQAVATRNGMVQAESAIHRDESSIVFEIKRENYVE